MKMDKLDKILKEIEKEMDEIKKLPPKERLERIRKLEQIREEELKKAEDLKEQLLDDLKQDEQKREEKEGSELDLEEKKKQEKERNSSLEDELEKDKAASHAKQRQKQENVSANLYRVVSGEDLYGGIRQLRDKAAKGNLSDEDLGRIDSYKDLIESKDKFYRRNDHPQEDEKDAMRAEYALKQIEAYRSGKRNQSNNHYQN